MSIEVEKDSCPYCSTKLQCCYINLTEKMLICTMKKCLFPFDVDDISPYIMKVDTNNMVDDNIAGSSSSSSNLLDDELTQFESTSTTPTTSATQSSTTESLSSSLLGPSRAKSNGLSTQSKRKFSNLSNSESLSSVPVKKVSVNSKSFAELSTQSLNPLNEVASNFPMSTSNSNDTITLKTLGITLKVDPTNKNKSRSESSRINGLSINNSNGNKNNSSTSTSDTIDMDFTQLFSMNNFPIPTAEGSSINAIGNGLLDANAIDTNAMDANATGANAMDTNATVANAMNANAIVANAMDINATDANTMDINATNANAMDANATNATDANAMDANVTDVNMDANATNNNATNSKDILTVEEYSKMLFGQSDIDINLDNLLSNPNMMDLNTQDNDAMDIDELLATFNSMESGTKTSGNDMDLDLESIMANLNGNFAEAGIPNGMSGNHLDMDIDSILASTNENILDLINSQNDILNGHLGIYSEVINGNNGILDLTLESVNGQNGFSHENFEKTKNGVVEDEGKEVKGKTTNEDSVKLTEGKKDG